MTSAAAAASRTVSAEEAAAAVRDGDVLYCSLTSLDYVLDAIAARRDLKDVRVRLTTPGQDPGWLAPEAGDERFTVDFQIFIGDFARFATDSGAASYIPNLFSTEMKQMERPDDCRFPDVFLTRVSRPNEKGYVNFGPMMFNKRGYVRNCRTVIAEIDDTFPVFHGDCTVHVSEIDYLVEGDYGPSTEEIRGKVEAVEDARRREGLLDLMDSVPERWLRGLLRRSFWFFEKLDPAMVAPLLGKGPEPDAESLAIAANVAEVVSDGANLQIGVGEPSSSLVRGGAFDGKRGLGLHSEMIIPGWTRLIREGQLDDLGKAFRPGVAVAAGWAGCTPQDLDFIAENPRCELHPSDLVLDPKVMAANERVHAINSAINVDLQGQINAETVHGARMINGTGGQPDSHYAAMYSKGGRAITVMKSTALGGAASRVVAAHEPGTVVTIPRSLADTIVTEHGVARLFGKSTRERAAELIAVAHPDFRAELRREAAELFGLRP